MPLKVSSQQAFFNVFRDSLPRDLRHDGTAFTLILGAGASRSAGVPLASEMVSLLKTIGSLIDAKSRRRFKNESDLSWLFRTVLSQVPWWTEDADSEREFISFCIARADREPNLTHLLAAHLVEANIFGPLLTTNFDDLALAAFWKLPYGHSGLEPHVIYDPRLSSVPDNLRIAPGVPIIVKAHGHHTIYALGILDKEIATLASHVEATIAQLRKPEYGFVVVGYSGLWRDGVIRALENPQLTDGRTVYWFHLGKPPTQNPNLMRIARCAEVRLIRIADSDALFLRMWHEMHQEEQHHNMPLFEDYDLFAPPGGFHDLADRMNRVPSRSWWDVRRIPWETHEAINHPTLVELRQKAMPLLKRLEQLDDARMLHDCAPIYVRRHFNLGRPDYFLSETPEMKQLLNLIPARLPWTRRNRKLLSLALGRHVDPVMPYILLGALNQWGLEVP